MKSLFQKFKMPIIIAGILIAAFVIFKAFFSGSTSDSVLTADNATTTIGDTFITQLRQLKQISLDPNVFNDDVFQSLSDFSQPLPDIPVGRGNPFSPVSGLDASANYASGSSTSGGLQFNSVSSATSSVSASTSTKK